MQSSFPVLVAFIFLLSISSRLEDCRLEAEQKPYDQWISQGKQNHAFIIIAILALTAATFHNIHIAGLHLNKLTVAGAATVFHRLPFSAARRRRTYSTHEFRLFYYNGPNEKRPSLSPLCSEKIKA